MPTQVYLCYSEHENKSLLRKFVGLLRASGIGVWFEEDDLKPGSRYDSVIREQIGEADVFVYILSHAACDLCEGKLGMAGELGKHVLPITLQSGVALPPLLDGIAFADFSAIDQPEEWVQETARLIASVDTLAKLPPPTPAPAPAAPKINLADETIVEPGRWVVSALSPYMVFPNNTDNLENIRRLLSYHQPALEALYLLATIPDPQAANGGPIPPSSWGVLKAYDLLQAWREEKGITAAVKVLPVANPNGVRDSYEQLTGLLAGLDAETAQAFILDITAGTKAMSAAMVAAAYEYGCTLTYQPSERDVAGMPSEHIPPIRLFAVKTP